jgi:hypothetical protein
VFSHFGIIINILSTKYLFILKVEEIEYFAIGGQGKYFNWSHLKQ